jgi:hypothetical protein
VTELGSVIDNRPGLARHSRKKNHEDAIKAGMHNCRSRSARSSTAVLRHRVSSTRSHSPGPLPSLIHLVYWLMLGSQSLLNPHDHPRYLTYHPYFYLHFGWHLVWGNESVLRMVFKHLKCLGVLIKTLIISVINVECLHVLFKPSFMHFIGVHFSNTFFNACIYI